MTEVSVVIPTRDRPGLLAVALRSVLRQDGLVPDVVVVDDGSGSATAALLQEPGYERVRLVRNTGPAGVSGARNTGIAAAHGAWIAFLDDDDVWAPAKLGLQLRAARDAAAGWVYAGDVTVDDDLRVRAGAPPPPPEGVVARLRRYNAVPAGASNVVVRRDVLDAAGRFDPELRTSEDWDLWLRLAAIGLPACVPRPLVAVRTHPGMASREADQVLADIEVIARRHGIPIDRVRHERWAAWMSLESGRTARALRHYARAARQGDLASVARAAAALAVPGIARRRATGTIDEWARQAQAWLDDLRPPASHDDAP